MWYLKNSTNESVYKIEACFADTENCHFSAQRGEGWG